MYASLLVFSASLLGLASADVTIYGLTGQTTVDPELALGGSTYVPEPTTTSYVTTHGPPQYTGLAAYNPVYMYPPAIPEPPPANQFAIGVPNDAALMEGLSVRQQGNFFGFSIEMSVATQMCKYFAFLAFALAVRGAQGLASVAGSRSASTPTALAGYL